MAEWYSVEEKEHKSCKMCNMLTDPNAFQQGLSVFVASAADCDKCEVAKAFPLPSNEDILFLYASLPLNFDGMTGLRVVTASDIRVALEVLEIPQDLRSDYFGRLAYYHSKGVEAAAKRLDEKTSGKKGKRGK